MDLGVTEWLLVAAPLLSALAGVGAVLRSEKPITLRAMCSAIINSGCVGFIVGAGMLHKFGEQSWLLTLAAAVTAGLAGNVAVDFFIDVAKNYVGNRMQS